jgi:glycosyltransferase involved in cell wall biosynthesis
MLARIIPELLRRTSGVRVLLLGRGSAEFARSLLDAHPDLAARMHATGGLPEAELSAHLRACDVMLQPYTDGVTARRTSTMAALEHGCAVVTTRSAITESIWCESGAVVTVDVDDPTALVDAVANLAGDPQRRAAAASAATRFYTDHFALPRTIETLRHAGAGR